MPATIEFTPSSARQLRENLAFVKSKFGLKTEQRVLMNIKQSFRRIEDAPESSQLVFPELGVYRALVYQRLMFFYRISDGVVVITAVKNTYQNYSPEEVS